MKPGKITNNTLPARRSYEDACGAAHALDLVGERWALLVMRELFFGPKRFSDLRADLPGVSANVLTQRLEGLEAAGIAYFVGYAVYNIVLAAICWRRGPCRGSRPSRPPCR